MKRGKLLRYSLVTGWFITAFVILIVALLFVPEDSRSNYFWYRIIWAEALTLLSWGSVFIYTRVSTNQIDSIPLLGAIAPTVSIIICTYSILSISVMVIHSYLPVSVVLNRVHWIFQIIIFAVAAFSIVLLSISRSAAASGLISSLICAETPRELHDLLAIEESSLDNPSSHGLRARIKQLREVLVYSLNYSDSLADIPEYQELNREIILLCKSIAGLNGIYEGQAHQINSLNETTIALIRKAKHISVKQMRR